MLNLILEGVKRTGPSGHKPFEYDMECDSVLVRLGPYDSSDFYKVVYLPDTNEVAVLLNDECVSSTLLEEV